MMQAASSKKLKVIRKKAKLQKVMQFELKHVAGENENGNKRKVNFNSIP